MSKRKAQPGGGNYCCMPQCNSRSTKPDCFLYRVPTGEKKRFGQPTKLWAEKFHQTLFHHRSGGGFEDRVRRGKAFICHYHFQPSDLCKSLHKSWIIEGALPTLKLPKKSHQILKKEEPRIILDRQINVKKFCKENKIEEVIKRYEQNADWRMYKPDESTVHFTYYKNSLNHASPTISLLLKQTSGKLYYSVSFDGKYAPYVSKTLNDENLYIFDVLEHLRSYEICNGFESVPDQLYWNTQSFSTVEKDGTLKTKKRFTSSSCLVAFEKDAEVCTNCMILHLSQLKDKTEKKLKSLKALKEHPPVSFASKGRLVATVLVQRHQISRLQEEFKQSDCNKAVRIKEIAENIEDI